MQIKTPPMSVKAYEHTTALFLQKYTAQFVIVVYVQYKTKYTV